MAKANFKNAKLGVIVPSQRDRETKFPGEVLLLMLIQAPGYHLAGYLS